MNIDVTRLVQNLSSAKAEDTVSTKEIHPYLLNDVVRPLLNGVPLCYGNVDFSRFDIDDLRTAARYCENLYEMSNRLEGVLKNIAKVSALACKSRAFC